MPLTRQEVSLKPLYIIDAEYFLYFETKIFIFDQVIIKKHTEN